MKNHDFIRTGRPPAGSLRVRAILLFCCCLQATFSLAALPQPSVIYYGQALNEYGWPYAQNAEVILRVNGQVRATQAIQGPISPGVNFALTLFLDDGVGERFDEETVLSGEPVTISVRAGGVEKPVLFTSTIPPVPAPGEAVCIHVTAGSDSTGSGIPDAWKLELMANSGGVYTNISQITGDGDLDGDGFSDLDEYRAGTMAFWDFDFFFVEQFARDGEAVQLKFLSVPGKAYRVFSTPDLMSLAWSERVRAGASAPGPFSGDGYLMPVCLTPTQHPESVRLGVDY